MSNTNKELIVFLDNIGRTIIGRVSKQTTDTISIENPALVHIQPNQQTNQIQLQLLPLFFREFQSNKTEPTTWNYKVSNVTLSDKIEFSPQFAAQYDQIFGYAQKDPEVVKLFDEE
jgi:hypothetical protein